jgi:TP901-1 family phage major tail protein
MAIVNATDVVLSIDTGAGSSYVKILHATSANLTINREMRDSTTKDSSGWSESLAGLKSWELSGDGFVDFDNSGTGIETDELITQMIAAAPTVTVEFGNSEKTYTGSAFITSISLDAGVEENATYSISLQGTGALA